jgi:hypothetical protein
MIETGVDPTICIANIGPNQRRRRLYGGLVSLAIGIVVTIMLLATGASRPARLLVLPFFYGFAAGYFQFREKT